MIIPAQYQHEQALTAEIAIYARWVVMEFGTGWCPHCQQAQSFIAQGFAAVEGVRYHKIEDGKGRRLGRLHRVKLWPTLIFLLGTQSGGYVEIARVVRPMDAKVIQQALAGWLNTQQDL